MGRVNGTGQDHSASRIVVDTSAWISYLRRPGSATAKEIASLLRSEAIILVGPAIAELLVGARSAREVEDLHVLIDFVGIAPDNPTDWVRAGTTAMRLRRRGITVPLLDVLVATMARRLGAPVLTHDRHFEHFEIPVIVRPLVTDTSL